jgi:protein SCO1/2
LKDEAMKKRAFFLTITTLLVLFSAACSSYEFKGTQYSPPRPAPALAGVNWDGRDFAVEDLKGTVGLVFFGYTFCPDICPMSLANMQQVHNAFPDHQDKISVVFVSVDPERDTPERLAQYVPAFDADFYGIHVPEADQEAMKAGYGVYAEKNTQAATQSAVDYLVDHTGWIYVIDKRGDLRLAFSHTTPAEEIIADVEQLLKERG